MACEDQALKTQRCAAVMKIPQLPPFPSAQEVTPVPLTAHPASTPTSWGPQPKWLGVLTKKVDGAGSGRHSSAERAGVPTLPS